MCIRDRDQMLATGLTDAKGVLHTPLSGWVKETMLYGTVIASKKGVGVAGTTIVSVSYTHLDVYKRQAQARP